MNFYWMIRKAVKKTCTNETTFCLALVTPNP